MRHQPAEKSPRLFVAEPLSPGRTIPLPKTQSHYLVNVMRLGEGDAVRLFNGTSGEWLCTLNAASRKAVEAVCREQLRPAAPLADIHYLFAPLKSARLDYMAQKATEMGACRLQPVFTERCVVHRVNLDRLRANVVEAAEQCNMVALPEVCEPRKLAQVLDGWDAARHLIFCDEAAAAASPLAVLEAIPPVPLAVLVGPEGGFSSAERARLLDMENVHPISLGPRIMRADTAAVAALALVQAVLGDWPAHQPA